MTRVTLDVEQHKNKAFALVAHVETYYDNVTFFFVLNLVTNMYTPFNLSLLRFIVFCIHFIIHSS